MEMHEQFSQETPILPLGCYFEIDQNGYLINPTRPELINPNFHKPIQAVVDLCREAYGDSLQSVFVRGSVARGAAVDGISDLDMFAITSLSSNEIKLHPLPQDQIKMIESHYPFIEGIEVGVFPEEFPNKDKMLIQSTCIYGTQPKQPQIKPGKEMAIHASSYAQRLISRRAYLETIDDPEVLKIQCVWLTKLILRTGFEVTMERSKRYTRSL